MRILTRDVLEALLLLFLELAGNAFWSCYLLLEALVHAFLVFGPLRRVLHTSGVLGDQRDLVLISIEEARERLMQVSRISSRPCFPG